MTAKLTIGALAEDFVAQWLTEQGNSLIERRWHCRWGELDLIAQEPSSVAQPMLVFVEVKARSHSNWDANGLLAITPQKQAKLWQAAQLFLATYPTWADHPCRFDVALVKYRSPFPAKNHPSPLTPTAAIQLGTFVALGAYQFCLQDYIQSAFE